MGIINREGGLISNCDKNWGGVRSWYIKKIIRGWGSGNLYLLGGGGGGSL